MTTTTPRRTAGGEERRATLELTTEEGQDLRVIRASHLSDLRMEIADTVSFISVTMTWRSIG